MADFPTAREFAEPLNMAVTDQWVAGFNACRELAMLREAAPPGEAVLTSRLDEQQRRILGLMPWQTGPIAHALVKLKLAEIPPKCEEEQAHVMHWLLTMYQRHGERWKDVAETVLAPARPPKKKEPKT
jgi:hypothetical protein